MTATYSPTELRFLLRLRTELGRRERVLRTGHVDLALSVRSSSSWDQIHTMPVFGFAIVAAMATLAASFMGGLHPPLLLNATLIFGYVAVVGIAFFIIIGLAAPARHVSEAILVLAEAEQEDRRVLAALRGRPRRAAAAMLASSGAAWEPPAGTPLRRGMRGRRGQGAP